MNTKTQNVRAYTKQSSCSCSSNTGQRKIREVGPVPQLSWVASNPDPRRMGRRRTIKYEQLMPTWRADVRIRRCRDGTCRPGARKLGEDDATTTHDVAMCTRGRCISDRNRQYPFSDAETSSARPTCDERDPHRARSSLVKRYYDVILSSKSPISLSDRKRGLGEPLVQIWRNIHLDTKLLRIDVGSVRVVRLRV